MKIAKEARILDIGTNIGSLPYELNKLGYRNIYGIDICKTAIEYGRKKYPEIEDRLLMYNGKELPFSDESFDAITMFDTIEHIPDISNFLKTKVYRLLKTDSYFIFQTPNKFINILWVYVDNKSLFVKCQEEHCSLQTYWSLRHLLKDSGFQNVHIEKHSILTEYNINKLYNKLGNFWKILKPIEKLPIFLYPNFYGWALKKQIK